MHTSSAEEPCVLEHKINYDVNLIQSWLSADKLTLKRHHARYARYYFQTICKFKLLAKSINFQFDLDLTLDFVPEFIFFQACQRAESSKTCNLIGSESGRNRWQLYSQVCLLFVNEQKLSFSNHFSFKTCTIIRISQGKVNFIIQRKNLQEESSKSARKTAKVNQNRWLVMQLRKFYNRAVFTAILLLSTFYWKFLLCLQFCFPFLRYESRFCRFFY